MKYIKIHSNSNQKTQLKTTCKKKLIISIKEILDYETIVAFVKMD